MTVNAVGFFVAAVVVVAAALACAILPGTRGAVMAAGGAALGTALLLALAGAWGVAVGELLVVGVTCAVVALGLPRTASAALAVGVAGRTRSWIAGAIVAAVIALGLVVVLAANSGQWAASGAGPGSLTAILHRREPWGLAVAVAALVTAAAGLMVVGRETDDERRHARAADERRRKQERADRRRSDRAAARGKSGAGRA